MRNTIHYDCITFYTFDRGEVNAGDEGWDRMITELHDTGNIVGAYITESGFDRNDGEDDADVDWTGYETLMAKSAREAAAMAASALSTAHGTVEALRVAVAVASASWTGLDWDEDDTSIENVASALGKLCELDSAGRLSGVRQMWDIGAVPSTFLPDSEPNAQAHKRARCHLGDRLDQIVRDGSIEAFDEVHELACELAEVSTGYVEGQATEAQDRGEAAIKAAEAGDWDQAVTEAEQACRIEREFGDDPSWRPVLAYALRGLALVEAQADFAAICKQVGSDPVTQEHTCLSIGRGFLPAHATKVLDMVELTYDEALAYYDWLWESVQTSITEQELHAEARCDDEGAQIS